MLSQDAVSRGFTALQNLWEAPGRAQDERQRRRRRAALEDQQKLFASMQSTLQQANEGNNEAALRSYQQWAPLLVQQADDVAARNNRNADLEAGRTIGVNTANAGLTQDTMETGGRVAANLIDTTGKNVREGINAQANAWANTVLPGVKEIIEPAIAANRDNTNAWIGGDGQSALQQTLAYLQGADQLNADHLRRTTAPWGFRMAGDLATTAAALLI